jgi:hypothetical protein
MPRKASATARTFPLAITKHQREALLSATRLRPKIKSRLKEIETGNIVAFTLDELNNMLDEVGTATEFAPDPYRKRLVDVQRKIVILLDAVQARADAAKRRSRRPQSNELLVFQFKVTLLDRKPPIWRRIQVKDCTLAELHNHIQAALGWWNYHLHRFVIEGIPFGPGLPDDFDPPDTVDEAQVLLSKLFKSGKRARFIYDYDFGDGWRHELIFEGYPEPDSTIEYRLCLEGERACPPEDVGGPSGFEEYVEIMSNVQHKRHKELKAWHGPFDPQEFDAARAINEMRKPGRDRL